MGEWFDSAEASWVAVTTGAVLGLGASAWAAWLLLGLRDQWHGGQIKFNKLLSMSARGLLLMFLLFYLVSL